MFIRSKTRKLPSGKTIKYAYLVKSKRRKKSKKPPKQHIIAYLGRIIELKDHQPTLTNPKDYKDAVESLLKQILESNGFRKFQKDPRTLKKDIIIIRFASFDVFDQSTNKDLCLMVNEGFISAFSLKNIFNYKPLEKNKREIGLDLAKNLISTGIKLKGDDFVQIFNLFLHRK